MSGHETRFAKANETRALIWAYLVVSPGRTAHEIARGALGKRGPTSASIPDASGICQRMQRDGQLTSRREYRPQQGREVTVWYAVPGAFAVNNEGRRPA